jgi:DNA repair protein RadA/Sms
MKIKIEYACQVCGNKSLKWLGKCPDCDSWNSFVAEEVKRDVSLRGKSKQDTAHAVPVSSVSLQDFSRIKTGVGEFDRVMGGGIVPGSLVLIGGEPGIGKSTILTQVANLLSNQKLKILYVTAEESLSQVRLRAERLGALSEDFFILSENSLNGIIEEAGKLNPHFIIIDSIQTIFLDEIPSAPGSVSQVRECAGKLMELAKKRGVTVFLVGHVTKEGFIAGPRVLEHLVDTVIYFEGDKGQQFRILRAVKNRFGSTNEIGLFEMSDKGLVDVPNLSEFFMSGRASAEPGSATYVAMEGTRPIVVEIQALASPTNLGVPRRMAMGIDNQRLNLLVAVLEKKIELPLFNNDIYVNVVGGLKLTETASDLAICMAIVSSYKNVVLQTDTVFIGEVGLLGEIRTVNQMDTRLKESKNMNFKKAVIPKNQRGIVVLEEMFEVATLEEAIELCFLR